MPRIALVGAGRVVVAQQLVGDTHSCRAPRASTLTDELIAAHGHARPRLTPGRLRSSRTVAVAHTGQRDRAAARQPVATAG